MSEQLSKHQQVMAKRVKKTRKLRKSLTVSFYKNVEFRILKIDGLHFIEIYEDGVLLAPSAWAYGHVKRKKAKKAIRNIIKILKVVE